MAQGLGSAVGVPTMNHYLSGFMLFFASFLLVMSDRYKAHLLAIKKHKEHLGNDISHCLKITQNVAFELLAFLAFFTIFCPIKTDLSGSTV